jgi:phenylacetate-CoA ligase
MKLTPLDPWIQQKIGESRSNLTRDAIENWQLTRLNETLALARSRSPFYRQLLAGKPDRINRLDEIANFPFTTPEDIRRNPLALVCVSQDDISRVVTLQSSGTTGEPKRVYFTNDDQELTIDFFGVGMSTFTKEDDRILILLPGEKPGTVGDLLRLGLERTGRIPFPHGVVRDMQKTIAMMNSIQADCIVGVPVQLLGLARHWEKGGCAPRSVLLSTDYVPMAIVSELKHIWGCEVFNHYGSTEMGLGGGVECEAHNGYHLREADLFFEVINPISGENMPEGEFGEVVFSTLTRQGMPLIRYRTGDRSRFIPGECPCGTCLKTLEKISGRYSGMIQISGSVLSLPEIDEVLFPIPDLLNYSVTVSGDKIFPDIHLVVQTINSGDIEKIVRQKLMKIPCLKDLKLTIQCQDLMSHSGNLVKRDLLDKRGQYA